MPYVAAAMLPSLLLTGPTMVGDALILTYHTIMVIGIVLFVLWLVYKILASVIYAVVALVILGVVLLQFHMIPSSLLHLNFGSL